MLLQRRGDLSGFLNWQGDVAFVILYAMRLKSGTTDFTDSTDGERVLGYEGEESRRKTKSET